MAIMEDGFSTIFEFAERPNVKFYEKTVTPPGMDGGGPNDVTTMRNIAYTTKAPKKLKDVTPVSATVAWDPAAYADVIAMLNVNQEITITFPDGDTLTVWGWLNRFVPNEHTIGSQPTAAVEIIIGNRDDEQDEVAPAFVASTTTSGG